MRTTVHVTMPDLPDGSKSSDGWAAAEAVILDQYPGARLSGGSRTGHHPLCNDRCGEECRHPYWLRYTYRIAWTRKVKR